MAACVSTSRGREWRSLCVHVRYPRSPEDLEHLAPQLCVTAVRTSRITWPLYVNSLLTDVFSSSRTSYWFTKNLIHWLFWGNLTCQSTRSQSEDGLAETTTTFLFLFQSDVTLYESIALKVFFLSSFESNSIRWVIRPQIGPTWRSEGGRNPFFFVNPQASASSDRCGPKSRDVELPHSYRLVQVWFCNGNNWRAFWTVFKARPWLGCFNLAVIKDENLFND